MELKDLLSMDAKDLKELNPQELLGELQRKPDILIAAVIILAALFFSAQAFLKNQQEVRHLRGLIANSVTKQHELNAKNDADQLLKAYLADIPKPISDKQFVNLITDLALQNEVAIQTFSPARKVEYPYYDLISVRLNVQAKTYAQLSRFVQDIELSESNVRVEYWDAEMVIPTISDHNAVVERRPGLKIQKDKMYFQANLEIALINIAHE